MERIALSVGRGLGVVSPALSATTALMALATTRAKAPSLHLLRVRVKTS